MQTTSFDPTQTPLADKAAAGIDRLSSGAHHAVDSVAQAAATAAEQIGQRSTELRAKQEMWTESARDCVRRHPIASVGIALGVGALLSLFGRSSVRH